MQDKFYFIYFTVLMVVFEGLVEGQSSFDPSSETRTVCTITSGDVEATAEATISRNIEGVCTSDELQDQFYSLHVKMLQELYTIKIMLSQAFNMNPDFQMPLPTHLYPPKPTPKPVRLVPTTPAPTPIPPLEEAPPAAAAAEDDRLYFPTEDNESVETFHSNTAKPLQMKQLTFARRSNTLVSTRDSEIHTFNNTMLKAGDAKIFTYFWKLEHFTENLMKGETEITSPVFTLAGLNLRIVSTMNYMGRDFLNIKIEQVSDDFLKNHKKSAVSIQTGQIFQRIEVKKKFRHKIIILDQGTPAVDLISQDFNDANSGFQIPINTLIGTRYVKKDTVLIRVVIYI